MASVGSLTSNETIQDNQAKYQQALTKLAYQRACEAVTDSQRVGFDLRGRAIFTLELNEADLKCLFKECGWPEQHSPPVKERLLAQLELYTGIKTASSVRCALDVYGNEGSFEGATAPLREAYEKLYPEYKAGLHENDLREYMSVIPLYEEILSYLDHYHHSILSYEGLELSSAQQTGIEHAYGVAKETLQEQLVEMTKGLSSSKGGIAGLNKALDGVRKGLALKVRDAFLDELEYKSESLFNTIDKGKFKDHFLHTAAHQHDMLGTDFANGTVSYITESGDRTAHNKPEWEALGNCEEDECPSAFRAQTRHQLSADGQITRSVSGRVSARIPSVADKEAKDEVAEIARIKKILTKNYLDLAAQKPDGKPVVYNLLTSLEGIAANQLDAIATLKKYGLKGPLDGKRNNQNKSADLIIKGVHAYNQTEEGDKGLIFLQNIGVNHFTENLGNFWLRKPSLVNEATLMADMAMLYTLYNNNQTPTPTTVEEKALQQTLKTAYEDVLALYKGFLEDPQRANYFAGSREGIQAVKKIKALKKTLKKAPLSPSLEAKEGDRMSTLASKALARIYANDDHYKQEYGNLVQALSIFLEDKSMSGCKSANERNEDVQKRVGLLIAMENRLRDEPLSFNLAAEDQERLGLSNEEAELIKALQGDDTEGLRKALGVATNAHRAYGDECSFSHADQQSASKLSLISKNLALAKGMVQTGLVLMELVPIIAGISILAAPFLPPLGLFGLGIAATLGLVAGASMLLGLVVTGAGQKVGYDTNTACEQEMKNIQNKHSKALQTHNDKGRGVSNRLQTQNSKSPSVKSQGAKVAKELGTKSSRVPSSSFSDEACADMKTAKNVSSNQKSIRREDYEDPERDVVPDPPTRSQSFRPGKNNYN